jgi:hypothetical protein
MVVMKRLLLHTTKRPPSVENLCVVDQEGYCYGWRV